MDRFIVEPTDEYMEKYQIFDNSKQESYDPVCLCKILNQLWQENQELKEDIDKYQKLIILKDKNADIKKIEVII